ncbi:type II restriction endonuclease, AlwI family [Campylobacter iguaniorum]|uniref:Type II restriction endonuclease, AlwI family n=1 Tax=Campylobacter iguaniorum TaxID=1244531 RepID=A0A076F7T0_9BACT|nr:AlwI family type II restriction endonuclease [Campylobacter iguaniorum]AII14106.1 type II restriction endonuclease, AlwI family [Campylobacter iguaniorum]ALV23845.1 type II restriction endonuclease, AlwI family [Campylobacter iguaniorum]
MARKFEQKILSFSTTIRNPKRIPNFLKILSIFENQILTNEIILKIVKNVINAKIYYPQQLMNLHPNLKDIFQSEDGFSDDELEFIVQNSEQNHKEKGFEKGWESRFDTWYKLMKEFGFCYYQKNKKILISNTGKMLINSIKDDNSIDDEIVSNVFLNAMSRYQVGNPFKKNSNLTTPFVLLLKLIEKLHTCDPNSTGIYRDEISILLCYPNNNVNELFATILNLRNEIYKISKLNFGYSDEFIYEKCLKLLNSTNETRFKISQITGEAIDEYIRKMRITGLISLRGNGRFLDFNKNEMVKINYILSKPIPQYENFLNDNDEKAFEFYKYMSQIDENFTQRQETEETSQNIKLQSLEKFALNYDKNFIKDELLITCSKNKKSDDMVLKLIDKPLRFEFLTSIILKQAFKNAEILPNYICDDEGIPIRFASGNKADIIANDKKCESYIEVSLMAGRIQVANEIIPIERHLLKNIENSQNKKIKFSIFVAPQIHDDVKRYVDFSKFDKNIDILCFSSDDFIKKLENTDELFDMCLNSI